MGAENNNLFRGTSSHSQRPRSVTARDVLEKAAAGEYPHNHLSNTNTKASARGEKQQQQQQQQRTPNSHRQNVVISDTITDLENGIQVESFEKQRLEALQRLNKKTSQERARSAKNLAANNNMASEDAKSEELKKHSSNEHASGEANDLNLSSNLHEDATISDSEVAGQAMTLRDRLEGRVPYKLRFSFQINNKYTILILI